MLGLWAVLTLTGALYSTWQGYGGRAYLLGTAVFLVYLIYALGTETFAFTRSAAVAGLVFIPLGLAATAERRPPGAWQDFLTMAVILLAVLPLPNPWGWSSSHSLWPFPGARLAYIFTVLLCVNVALAAFVLLRRVTGTGYFIGWGRHWGFFILASFLVFACISF